MAETFQTSSIITDLSSVFFQGKLSLKRKKETGEGRGGRKEGKKKEGREREKKKEKKERWRL